MQDVESYDCVYSSSFESNRESSFSIEFPDGFTFKHIIEYLRITNSHGTFIFKKDSIMYMQGDANSSILNEIIINTSSLKYEFESANESIDVGINIQDIRTLTKNINKRDGMILIKPPNEDYLDVIHIDSKNQVNQSCGKVRLQYREQAEYELPVYSNDENNPNFSIPASEFCRKCNNISSVKCDTILINCYPKGARFDAFIHGGVVEKYEPFGSCDIKSGFIDTARLSGDSGDKFVRLVVKTNDPVPIVKVRTVTVKALSKLNNLSTNGTIRFYMEPNNPIKIISPISSYGILRIYIKNYDSD